MPRRSLAIILLLLAAVAIAALCSTRLGGLDPHQRARRVLLWHGIVCEPKIVERIEEGELRVVCADGKHWLSRQPSCDESWPCALGITVACWDYAPG